MTTLGVIRDHMGGRTMWLYLAGIISCSLVLGLLVNLLFTSEQVTGSASHAHNILPWFIEVLCVLVLVLLALWPLMCRRPPATSCCEGENNES